MGDTPMASLRVASLRVASLRVASLRVVEAVVSPWLLLVRSLWYR
jgi:hypothetical protein